MLYPYLSSEAAERESSGLSVAALGNLALAIALPVAFFWYGFVWLPGQNEAKRNEAYSRFGIPTPSDLTAVPVVVDFNATPTRAATATPLHIVVEVVTPTPAYVPPAPDTIGSDGLPPGYRRQTILGRFSNYWPPLGGINCAGDCEHLADGTRTDRAIQEGWRVVACPPEILLGSRIEWPPGSGVVWVCRDRGEAITSYFAENGLQVFWFDFLMPQAAVDYGSYIQVDLFVPVP